MDFDKILRDLYNGQINPQSKEKKWTDEYKGLVQEMVGTRENLTRTFTDEQEKLFEEYVNASLKLSSYTCEEFFTDGFKLGGEMAIAILYKGDDKG